MAETYYVLQYRRYDWESEWQTLDVKFPDYESALAALEERPVQHCYRIAEAYTVTRYKPVKMGGSA